MALACAGALLAAALPAAGARAATRSPAPRADGEVHAAQPGRVLGTGRSLCARGAAGDASHAYLRFRVRVPRGRSVRAATLRLYALTGSGPFAIVLRAVPKRRWSERTLTWRTAPPPGGPVATATGYARGAAVNLDASALVKGSGIVEMALTTRSGRCLRFASREARRARRPRLVVETGRPAPPAPWTLVFDDEFDGASLDQSKWATGNFTGTGSFYAPSNVLLRNGRLRLRASSANRSAMVHTHGRYEFTYGRVEASMRVPRGQGFWPSLWLRPADLSRRLPGDRPAGDVAHRRRERPLRRADRMAELPLGRRGRHPPLGPHPPPPGSRLHRGLSPVRGRVGAGARSASTSTANWSRTTRAHTSRACPCSWS